MDIRCVGINIVIICHISAPNLYKKMEEVVTDDREFRNKLHLSEL